jgi:hypothetical protein
LISPLAPFRHISHISLPAELRRCFLSW